jgi:hypothetical protein
VLRGGLLLLLLLLLLQQQQQKQQREKACSTSRGALGDGSWVAWHCVGSILPFHIYIAFCRFIGVYYYRQRNVPINQSRACTS